MKCRMCSEYREAFLISQKMYHDKSQECARLAAAVEEIKKRLTAARGVIDTEMPAP